ncbi:probable ATP-dependent RNA helicase DHX34 [Amyelois transitella]|uniref:probable ATP-dependent RNA helicase DHX34 n=1 Tax=Amyelois transitella TaxID=680683 RepID=UPI00067BE4EE|nr:probable ATP-dependent RNA helicase DHX34 [Amyelois transitella]
MRRNRSPCEEKSSKCRRSRSYDRSTKYRKTNPKSSTSNTNHEADFSFTNYKRDLNKIIQYSSESNTVANNLDDFWVFLKKYEATLKKAGKPLLEKPNNVTDLNDLGVPEKYSKYHCINFTTKLKYVDIASDDRDRRKLDKELFDVFLNIVSIYVDFKNKEKFEKLKKLRECQKQLPVASFRNEIVSAVQNERVVIVAGDTGCGKSTQVPQYLNEAGFQNIACTQPRRIACVSLSKRVAYEMLAQFDTKVGYQIRFEKSRTADTNICFITEGLLLRQMSSDNLPNYDVIILDEIHERHLMGDFLLGVLKCLVHNRRDIKLVLMSATINIQLFQDYFAAETAVIIQVPGRLHPIDLQYKPIFIEDKPTREDRLDPQPYVQIMQLIDGKYPNDERGDMLIFMSGVQEITAICDAAQQYAEKNKNWIVLPLHSGLSLAEQDKVFDYPPEGVRKCIVSTNIAETSVTIDGIRFVVDSGKVKEMSYDSTTKMQRLKEFWISQASADQRKGRAGRTGPGVCYRIYSEKQYSEMDPFSTPEVSRVPLASLLLLMSSLGVSDVRRFPFIDAPPEEAIENALLELKQHGALTSNERLTSLGKALSSLPVDVCLAKALVVGAGTLPPHKRDSALALAAALGIRSIYTTRAHRDFECENARKPEESDHGDPLTLLSLYCAWLSVKAEGKGGRAWCRRRGIEEQRLYELTKLAAQLRGLLQDNNLMETVEPEAMSSAERSLRHGQMKQLKDMRRQYKLKAAEDSKRKKRLKVDSWEIAEEGGDGGDALDIRDIEFRLCHDAGRVRALIAGASAAAGRDLITLKVVLCRALYPQIAVADEFNHCKSISEQLFHTWSKPFVFLHPTSMFGRQPRLLQLTDADIQTDTHGYKARVPVSAKHQILCYLSLLETTKPYIVNSMRMPAAQTLLLLAHCIDTNVGFTRIVCDSWLLLEFPYPDSGLNLLLKATKLRQRWDALINRRLADANPNKSVEGELQKQKKLPYDELQHELSCDISSYMNSEVYYTIKRLLPGDLKVLYHGPDEAHGIIDPNPFEEGFECRPHEKKGGVYVTDNVVFNCVVDSDWSYNSYQENYSLIWTCPECDIALCLSPLERVQHKQFTCSSRREEKRIVTKTTTRENRPNAKEYKCENCNENLYMTPVEILKHKKCCNIKELQ